MGITNDTITKAFMKVEKNFADLFNYYVFDGEQVIKEENLRELDPHELLTLSTTDENLLKMQKVRDIFKSYIIQETDDAVYLLLGIENQSAIHYAMPVRNALYDAINYMNQIESIAQKHKGAKDLKGNEYTSRIAKNDKLRPIITLVVYFGKEKWDAPISLHEMFDEYPPEILRLIPDYKINLLCLNEIEDFEKFHTEVGYVFHMMKCCENKRKMREFVRSNPLSAEIPNETKAMIESVTGIKIKEEYVEGGIINMCKALDELKQEGIEEGMRIGFEKGVSNRLAQMLKNGISESDLLEIGFTHEEIEAARKINC